MSARRDREGERGQVLVLAMLAMVVLLGVSALAIDYGRWLVMKRDYQNRADAAVLAGARFLATGEGDEQTDARTAAWASIRDGLGLAIDPTALGAASTPADGPVVADGYRIWVASPATDAGSAYLGRYTGARTVFARIEREDRPVLAAGIGAGTATVGSWATAGRHRYRFGIQILCPLGDSRCPPSARDLKIAGGTQGSIRVREGDVGSNWGLQITSSSAPGLIVEAGDVYLAEINPGAAFNPPPWTTGGVNPGRTPHGPNVWPVPLGSQIDVPAWNPPPWIDRTAGADCAADGCVPLRADFACGGGGAMAPCGTVVEPTSPAVTCGPDAPHLAPGTYDTIDIRAGCVVLDPAPPGWAECTQDATTPVPATVGLCAGQTPGVFRIRRELSVGSGQAAAFLLGDGVSLVLDAGARVRLGNSGALVLDTGNVLGTATDWSQAAWTNEAASPWPPCAMPGTSATDPCVAPAAYGSTGATGLGLTIDVRAAGVTDLATGCGPTIESLTMNGSFGLQFAGALFAPCTNVALGASPYQGTVGAIVAWTLFYNGQTELQVLALGPPVITPPYLLEPTLGE